MKKDTMLYGNTIPGADGDACRGVIRINTNGDGRCGCGYEIKMVRSTTLSFWCGRCGSWYEIQREVKP